MEKRKGFGESVKDSIIATIKGTGEVAGTLIDTVSDTMVKAVRGGRGVGSEIASTARDATRGAIQGTSEIGGDLGAAAKNAVIGVLKGTREIGDEAMTTVRESAGSAVKTAAEVGGDVGEVAKGAVEGAIKGARDLGLSAEEAASEAATGALKAAADVGGSAVNRVRDVLKGTISGVKVVVKEPFSRGDEELPAEKVRVEETPVEEVQVEEMQVEGEGLWRPPPLAMAIARKGSAMISSTAAGIYFHPQRHEILAVTSATVPPGEPWVKFADDYSLGLLAARRELRRLGIMQDANGVEWHGMATADLAQRQRVSGMIRTFREDSDRLRSQAESKQQDIWQRLVSAITPPIGRGEEA